jgi:hypothetical protein
VKVDFELLEERRLRLIEPLNRVLKLFSFGGPMPITLHADTGNWFLEEPDEQLYLVLRLASCDATTPERAPTIVERRVPLPEIRFDTAPGAEMLVSWIHSEIRTVWMHEFYEWLRFNGELWRDPHAKE